MSTAGHLNRGLQFRSAAKRRKSVKGDVGYIHLTIFDILIIRYQLNHYSLGKKKNRSGSKNRNIGLVKGDGLTLREGNFLDGLRDNLGLPKSKGLNRNRAKKFGSSLQETKAVKGMMSISTKTYDF